MERLAERKKRLEKELQDIEEQLRHCSLQDSVPRRDRGRGSAFWRLLTKWQGHLFSGESVESLFASVDKDGSGFIDRDEVQTVSKRLGMVLQEGQFEGRPPTCWRLIVM